MALPPDPDAFLQAAAQGINDYDLEATAGVYADTALLESYTDGARETYKGIEEIRTAWAGYLGAMRAREFKLAKRRTAVEGDTLVNEWSGSLGGRTDAEGIERWTFDADGKVVEHRMYSFLNVKPSTSPLQRLRLALAYPRTALAFLREQKRAR